MDDTTVTNLKEAAESLSAAEVVCYDLAQSLVGGYFYLLDERGLEPLYPRDSRRFFSLELKHVVESDDQEYQHVTLLGSVGSLLNNPVFRVQASRLGRDISLKTLRTCCLQLYKICYFMRKFNSSVEEV